MEHPCFVDANVQIYLVHNKSMGRVDTVKQRDIHINHCIDMVLQTLQCSGNVNLIHYIGLRHRSTHFQICMLNTCAIISELHPSKC